MDINERVLLLAIYKKEKDESLQDILITLENSRVFTLKDGKKLLKNLKKSKYIIDGILTLSGETKAKEIEDEFKID